MDVPSKQIENTAFFAFLALVSFAFLAILAGFIEPILWATILALIFRAPNYWLRRLFRGRNGLAALATLVVILTFVIIPTLLVSAAVVDEGTAIVADIQAREFDPATMLSWLEERLPTVRELAERIGLDWAELRGGLSDAALTTSQFVASKLLVIGQNALRTTLLLFVMLYLLFFLLRDGERIVAIILDALPLGDAREAFLIQKMAEVLRATVKGTFVIGLVQGFLGGLIFAALGIRAAVLWGVVMALLSMLPVIGAAVIWLPAALILASNGDWIKALILAGFGAVVISLVDNLLRPWLVGRDTKMPDYLVLLSTLGGLALFGLSGFVLGPTVAAVFLASWALFAREFNQPPAANS